MSRSPLVTTTHQITSYSSLEDAITNCNKSSPRLTTMPRQTLISSACTTSPLDPVGSNPAHPSWLNFCFQLLPAFSPLSQDYTLYCFRQGCNLRQDPSCCIYISYVSHEGTVPSAQGRGEDMSTKPGRLPTPTTRRAQNAPRSIMHVLMGTDSTR